MLKIIIHDYAGHPFQFELSKTLSKEFKIYHLYYANDYGPKGDFNNLHQNLVCKGVGENILYNKNNFFFRFFKDLQYGYQLGKKIDEIKPDIVISGNCPTFAQEIIFRKSKKNKSIFILWVQDFYSIAVEKILKKKLFFIYKPISFIFNYFEKKQFKLSNHIIVISDHFINQIKNWKIKLDKISVIKNWGNLEKINFEQKNLEFLNNHKHDTKKFHLVYTGTLALKHNPDLITKLAIHNPKIEILVFGVGSGIDALKKIDLPNNIKIYPLQPFEKLSSILNTADAFLAMINEDAGEFSVPSKVLNYLCAGRPILISAPKNNLASKIIDQNNAGKSFDPSDFDGLNKFLNEVYLNEKKKLEMSKNARNYAEKNFNINDIALKFKKIFQANLK